MLLQNGTLLNQYPITERGGALAGLRTHAARFGDRFNVFSGGFDPLSGAVPAGHLHPSAWVMPKTAGGMSAFTSIVGTGTASATLTPGRNLEGALTGSGAITDANLALIVSAVAALVGSGGASGSMTGALQAAAALTGSSSVAASLGAIASLLGSLTGSGAASATPSAQGSLSASITSSGELLTAANVGSAVWSKIIESGLSAEDILRLILAVQSNDATGLDGNPIFLSVDGSKTRVAGTRSGGTRTITTRDGT